MPHGSVEAFAEIAGLPDIDLGTQDDGLVRVQGFLCRFGYLLEGSYAEGTLDEQTSEALTVFQRRNALMPTGVLDQDTRDAMTTARCGIPDTVVAFVARCPWNRMTLSFAFGPGTADTAGEFDAVRRAFRSWSEVRPFMFAEVDQQDNPDVVVDWRDANDPDLSMIGGILAHADFPPDCGVVTDDLPKPVHFDDSEHTWAIGAATGAFDVETVALHEIGHILGLQHSDVNGAVMFPSVSSNFTLRVLQPDDQAGIRELYPDPQPAPDEPGGPAVTADGPNALDVFVRGKHNHELVHRFFDGGKWSGWINLGGDLAAGPAVTAGGPHVLDVFVRGKHNDELVHRFWNGTKWSGWINLGGDLASAPAVTAGGPHALDVFVRGKHNHELVHRFFDGGKWSGWINLGGDLAAGPAVTAGGPHVLDVFVRGKHNDELVHRFWNGTKWSGWINLGGDLASAPAVTAGGPHALDVFVRGKHNHELVHRFFDGGKWSGWINLGGDLAAGPAVTAGGPHVLDVFVRGKHNDELVHRFWNGTKWSGWINLGGDLD